MAISFAFSRWPMPPSKSRTSGIAPNAVALGFLLQASMNVDYDVMDILSLETLFCWRWLDLVDDRRILASPGCPITFDTFVEGVDVVSPDRHYPHSFTIHWCSPKPRTVTAIYHPTFLRPTTSVGATTPVSETRSKDSRNGYGGRRHLGKKQQAQGYR